MPEKQKAQESSQKNILDLLGKLDPAQLVQAQKAINSQVKANSDALTEQKSAFMTKVAKLFEKAKLPPPEECRVTFTFSLEGEVTEKRYQSGTAKSSGGGNSGTGESTPVPPVGSTAYRTHQGKDHSLLIAGDNDFVLNGKEHFNSPSAAARAAKGSDVPIDGRKWWFTQGRTEVPK